MMSSCQAVEFWPGTAAISDQYRLTMKVSMWTVKNRQSRIIRSKRYRGRSCGARYGGGVTFGGVTVREIPKLPGDYFAIPEPLPEDEHDISVEEVRRSRQGLEQFVKPRNTKKFTGHRRSSDRQRKKPARYGM